MNKKHLKTAVLPVLLAVCLIFTSIPVSAADTGTDPIHIASAADWEQLAADCRLDIWSEGKTVLLDADLDLTGCTPIPTFGGVFNGQNHTITGKLSANGDHQGLFRYVREGASVKNLTLSGSALLPGDSAVGGIAGVNSGTISGCHFTGVVSGVNSIGGIAGINEESGEIISCTSSGNISGEHFTGGIAGENYGSIIRCTNRSQVNTQAAELSPQLEEMNWSQINSTENMPACTDTGGITGYSAGILQNCSNTGAVGYPHIGYNVGGIAGRQTGYMSGCANTGTVQGRKEVGGIVGQTEPHTLLRYKEDTLEKLAAELDVLGDLLGGALNDGDSSRHDLSSHLTSVSQLTGDTQKHVSALLDELETLGDGTVDTINDFSARISHILDSAVPVTDSLADTSALVSDAMAELENAMDSMNSADPAFSEAAEILRDAIREASSALNEVNRAAAGISDALENLWNSLGDDEKVQEALTSLKNELSRLEGAYEALAPAVESLKEAFRQFPADLPQAAEALGDILDSVLTMSQASRELAEAVWNLWSASADTGAFPQLLEDVAASLEHFSSASILAGKAMQTLKTLSPSLDEIWQHLSVSSQSIEKSFGILSEAGDSMAKALTSLHDMVEEQAALPPLELPKLGSSFHEKEDRLGSSLEQLNGELEGINQVLNQAGDNFSGTLRKINDQFGVITGLLRSSQENTDSESGLIVDISDENIAAETLGKVQSCINNGLVDGDVNVGGITGAMAIEFDFDPEDDVTNQNGSPLNFQYLTRAILQDCVNRGTVTARKNYAGGIIGRMDLGVTLDCQNYGPVESTGGEYIGGIAGSSVSAIRDCWAKCALKGSRRVGGIAGYASDVQNCRSLVRIHNADSYMGAIAGEAAADFSLSGNTFVSETLGGVDGISYAGKAAPLPYKEFLTQENTPAEFSSLTLTFCTDEEVIAVIPCTYGDPVPPEKIPEVPEKEGFCGEWSDFDREALLFDTTVEAVYQAWQTALASEDGLILAEGQFSPEASLTASAGTHTPPDSVKMASESRTLTLSENEKDFTAVRMAIPEGMKRPALLQYTGSGWEELPSVTEGHYLRAELSGQTAEICIVQTPPNLILWILCGAGGAGLLLVIVLLIVHQKRKKSAASPKA